MKTNKITNSVKRLGVAKIARRIVLNFHYGRVRRTLVFHLSDFQAFEFDFSTGWFIIDFGYTVIQFDTKDAPQEERDNLITFFNGLCNSRLN